LPKATRAELHERFAAWLEARGMELVELDEIVGYHLEQAFRYRGELGPLTDTDWTVAAHAGELLARAGRRAIDRGDRLAAASLLERAAQLLPEDTPERILALVDRGRVLVEAGHDYQGARVALERAGSAAEAIRREDLVARAKIELSFLKLNGWGAALWDSMREPMSHAIEHAQRAGNKSLEREVLNFLLGAILFGSTPVPEGIAATQKIREQHPDSPELQAWTARVLGTLIAVQGDEGAGRELLEEARAIFAEMGHDEALAVLAFSTAPLELRAGNPVAAERELRASLETLQAMGDRARGGSIAAMLTGVLAEQRRLDEANECLEVARELVPAIDTSGLAQLRMAEARVSALRGESEDAVRLATEAITLIEGTQELLTMPDLLLGQADVLELAGRTADAEEALRKAADAAARKGALVDERRARERLAALGASH
jgi:tetratricopeptide (TPR) repeat protein